MHLSHVPNYAKHGFLGKIDIAIVEAVAIAEEGYIIPSTSVGATPTYLELAEKVIIKINTTQLLELEGMHDIYVPNKPPYKAPIPIFKTEDRIGEPFIWCFPDKIAAIVFSDIGDGVRPFAPVDEVSKNRYQIWPGDVAP